VSQLQWQPHSHLHLLISFPPFLRSMPATSALRVGCLLAACVPQRRGGIWIQPSFEKRSLLPALLPAPFLPVCACLHERRACYRWALGAGAPPPAHHAPRPPRPAPHATPDAHPHDATPANGADGSPPPAPPWRASPPHRPPPSTPGGSAGKLPAHPTPGPRGNTCRCSSAAAAAAAAHTTGRASCTTRRGPVSWCERSRRWCGGQRGSDGRRGTTACSAIVSQSGGPGAGATRPSARCSRYRRCSNSSSTSSVGGSASNSPSSSSSEGR
jgi:hypothetical protein